jgi:hypothetical protein
VKWSQRVRETGSAAPAKFSGYRTCVLEPHRDFVLARFAEVSRLTLHELILAVRGIETHWASYAVISLLADCPTSPVWLAAFQLCRLLRKRPQYAQSVSRSALQAVRLVDARDDHVVETSWWPAMEGNAPFRCLLRVASCGGGVQTDARVRTSRHASVRTK